MNYEEYLKEVAFLTKCSESYYGSSKSIIPDHEFDARRRIVQLYEIENDVPDDKRFSTMIGAAPSGSALLLRRHTRGRLSLENALDAGEAHSWIEAWAARYGYDCDVVAEYKHDGMATILRYMDGNLIMGLTRGDGETGEDITRHVEKYVPNKIQLHGTVEVEGESVMSHSLFKRLLEEGTDYANCRNAVAGILRKKETTYLHHQLTFIPYGIVSDDDVYKTQADKLAVLRDLGFASSTPCGTTVGKIQPTFDSMIERSTHILDHDIDGVVFKINGVEQQRELGETSHSPRWAFAYKRPPVVARCQLLSVSFQIGRSGELTPVGKINPTQLMGVVVTSVSLHNEERMAERGTAVGNYYEIYRSGDVIPHLGRCLEAIPKATPVVFPTTCPCCGSEVKKVGAAYYCSAPQKCSGAQIAQITYAASRDVLDIEGIAEQTATALYKNGIVHSYGDVLSLDAPQFVQIGMSVYMARKMAEAVHKATRADAYRFIMALGIPDVGKTTAREIVRHIGSLVDFLEWTDAQKIVSMNIPKVGKGTAQNIANFMLDEELRERARTLFSAAQAVMPERDGTVYVGVTDKIFVFSGGFEKGKAHLEKLVTDRGGIVSSSVSRKTDYFVWGPGSGEKKKRADVLGIAQMGEEEFLALIDNGLVVSYF